MTFKLCAITALLAGASLAPSQINIPTIVNVTTDPGGACASPGTPLQYNTTLNNLWACQGAAPGPYSWAKVNGSGGGGITGSGTINTLSKFTAGAVVGNSSVTDNGTTVATTEPLCIGASCPANAWFTGTGGLLGLTIGTCTGSVPAGAIFPCALTGGYLEEMQSGRQFVQGPLTNTANDLICYTSGTTGITQDCGARPIGNAQLAIVQTRRTCVIDNDTQSATALAAAQFSGRCVIPAASTIVEVDVIGGTGTLNGTPANPTVTGTGSVQIGKYGVTNNDALLSAALATASGVACALTSTSGTCVFNNGMTSSNSVTISTTALSAGDVLYIAAATADAAQTWYTTTIVYTVN